MFKLLFLKFKFVNNYYNYVKDETKYYVYINDLNKLQKNKTY